MVKTVPCSLEEYVVFGCLNCLMCMYTCLDPGSAPFCFSVLLMQTPPLALTQPSLMPLSWRRVESEACMLQLQWAAIMHSI